MFYFKFGDDNLISINIDGKNISSEIENKIKISFNSKYTLDIHIYDIDGNLIPIKKNSPIRKNIFNSLQNKEWNKFIIEGSPIDGIVNEENELIEPIYALYPRNIIKEKINPYQKWTELFINNGINTIDNENEIILKKRIGDYLHLYFRKENNIWHVCLDEIEQNIIEYELFSKIK